MALTGKSVAEQIWNFLKSKGYSDYGVAGLMGNLHAESGLIPNNLQNTSNASLGMSDAEYTEAVDSGTYTNFVRDAAGYGLAQWTYWSRKQGLLNLAKNDEKSIGDLELQLDYLFIELTSSFQSVHLTLKTAGSVMEASNAVLKDYERPADMGLSVQTARAKYGQNFYDQFAGNAAVQEPVVTTPEQKTCYSADKLIEIARAELGYIEKASNSQLDSPAANPGAANWTKYARDLAAAGYYNGGKNGYAWCDVFVDWCFYVLAGRNAAKAQEIECQTGPYGAGCIYSAQYYQQQNRYSRTDPHVGDQVFFEASGEIAHTGIVEKVEGNTITTIEGNSGNKVSRHTYSLPQSYVHGFGRPKYDVEAAPPPAQTIPGGPVATDYITVKAPELKKGCSGTSVLVLQNILLCRGGVLPKYGADSDFGEETETAVKAFQSANGLEIDGEVGTQTWGALLT